ncbi:hypothetical protein [Streptomyces sp. NBC_01176]|uniref:hypothetical protein n=1 Tax=Streptomyces sp. NBC_01176 TaxID=2903760 RepID=UPI00386FDC09|nr:hypothetical protein OG199_04700 [Streptomyces sp. NBC_01176]
MTQGDVPAYELARRRLDEVSPTPLNPRRNFGTDEDKTRFGEELRKAQLAVCVAVSRTAYLALWPDHAERIGEAAHILFNGERRFRSAVHIGMDSLDFVVRDDLASSVACGCAAISTCANRSAPHRGPVCRQARTALVVWSIPVGPQHEPVAPGR